MTKKFKLTNIPAVLRSVHVLGARMAPMGGQGKPTQIFEVELTIDVNVENCMKSIEPLFIGADDWAKCVSGSDGENAGEDRVARTKLPDQDLTLVYGDDDKAKTVAEGVAAVKKKVKLGVDKDGKARLVVKTQVKFNRDQMIEACLLIEADMRVTMKESTDQYELPAINASDPDPESGEGEKGKKGKGPKTVLRSVDATAGA